MYLSVVSDDHYQKFMQKLKLKLFFSLHSISINMVCPEMFQDHSGVHLLQVHRKLSELYGRIFSSSTHTQQHRSSRKWKKLEDGSAELAEQQLPPRIVLQFRGSPPDKMKRVKDEVCTKFVMRKTNLVSSL